MNHHATAIAIDLGGSAIKYGLVNGAGTILLERLRPTPLTSREALLEALAGCIREMQRTGAEPAPSCVGIGTPGLVDAATGSVAGAAFQLPGWENFPLAAILSDAVGLPVFADNDANLMGLGEFMFGSHLKTRNTIFLTLGTGIGGAIFIDGQLYRGRHNASGELGYFPFDYAGREGYWEDFASMRALVEQYNRQAAGGDAVQSARQVFEKAAQGEALAQDCIAENARLVGRGIAGYINVFNPDTIIIGGGISDTQMAYFDRVREAAFRYALTDCSRGVEIVAASLGNKAGLVGAGWFALSLVPGA